MRSASDLVPAVILSRGYSRSHRSTPATRCAKVPISLSQFFLQSQNMHSKPGRTFTWSLCKEKFL